MIENRFPSNDNVKRRIMSQCGNVVKINASSYCKDEVIVSDIHDIADY